MSRSQVDIYELCNDCLQFDSDTEAKNRVLKYFSSLKEAIRILRNELSVLKNNSIIKDAKAKLLLVENRTNNPEYMKWVIDNYSFLLKNMYQILQKDIENNTKPLVHINPHKQDTKVDMEDIRSEALKLLSEIIEVPKEIQNTKIVVRTGITMYDIYEDTIFIETYERSKTLLILIHEYIHAIHYAIVRKSDLPNRKKLITRFGLSSPLKEGVGYVLMQEAAGKKYETEAEELILEVFARSAREMQAFLNKDMKAIEEFLRLPGYKTSYAAGIKAVREIRKKYSWQQIFHQGFVNLETVSKNLPVIYKQY